MNWRKIAVLWSIVLAAEAGRAATYYVSPSGNDANNGTSWALAKLTINAGVGVATNGDTVLVANGAYLLTATIAINQSITLKSVNGAQFTTIDGGDAVQCVSIVTNAVLDGFTVTNGYSISIFGFGVGGGVDIDGGMVQNCTISGNTANYGGGGVRIIAGTLQNCTISGNTAPHSGGVLCLAEGTVQNCMISGNTAGGDGGGVDCANGGTVKNCIIIGNTAGGSGGGVYINGGDTRPGTVESCTICGNTAVWDGGGAYFKLGGTIVNCIIYFNNTDWFNSGGTANYNCSPTAIPGTGNITNDPGFVANGSGYGASHIPGDYHLTASSPCRNTGLNQDWMTNAMDLDGFDRINENIVDRGAYEYRSDGSSLSAPTGLAASDGNYTNKVVLTWNAVYGAILYEVWRNTTTNSSGASKISDATGTTYDDTTASPDTTYYYWVKARNSSGSSEFSSSDSGYRASALSDLSAPASVTATDGVFTNKVRITWTSVSNATSYEVWGNVTNNTGSAMLKGETAETTYDDTNALPGSRVYYWVKSKTAAGTSWFSTPDSGYAGLGASASGVADLSLANLTFLPSALAPGASPTQVTLLLQNNGPANMATLNTRYVVDFYLSSNATFGDLDDVWIGQYAGDVMLDAGLSSSLMITNTALSGVVIPSTLNGLYSVFARVDHALPSTLADTNGNNNVALRSGTVMVSSNAIAGLAKNDYDGDGASDLAIWDPASGNWYLRTMSGTLLAWGVSWGWPGAKAVEGDYDADGVSDLAVFDGNTGYWYIQTVSGYLIAWSIPWGWPGAIPVSGDYDADGLSDLAVFDNNTGSWFVRSMATNVLAWGVSWGWPGAIPVPGDFNGDGVSDLSVFDSNTGYWYIRTMSGTTLAWAVAWGWPGAIPVSGDYDGDGLADIAVFDSNTGYWFIQSVSGTVLGWQVPWGWPGAVPVSGDYDGDGVSDLAIWDPASGFWYIRT
ncbi:MAG: VCBS repeat-containing protein, partial [Lentisphaerae bacterium]|nr:VCBS repeat-containing protein [Lentisphaerota bacterium]